MLTIREMKIKTIKKYHFTRTGMAKMKKDGQTQVLTGYGETTVQHSDVDGNVKWCNHFGEQFSSSSNS